MVQATPVPTASNQSSSGLLGSLPAVPAVAEPDAAPSTDASGDGGSTLAPDRALTEHMLIALVRSAADGRFLDANAHACEVLGYGMDEVRGLQQRDLVVGASEEDRAAVTAELAAGRDVVFERTIRRKDGGLLRAEIRARPLPDGSNLAVIVDRTEQRAAEAALRASQERLQAALEGSGVGLWEVELKSGSAWVSDRLGIILGYLPGKALSTVADLESLVHPEDLGLVLGEIGRLVAGQIERLEVAVRLRRGDGTWAWILDRGRVIERHEDGSPLRLAGTHTDITDLRARDEHLRFLLDNAFDGVVVLDEDLRVVRVSPRAFELLGCDRNLAGVERIVDAFLAGVDRKAIHERLATSEGVTGRTTVTGGDGGTVRVEHRMRKLPSGQVGVVLRDVTAEAAAEAALRASEESHRRLLEGLHDAVMLLDASGRIRALNPRAAELVGAGEEAIGLALADAPWTLLDADGQPLSPELAPSAEVLRTGQPVTERVIGIRRADGSVRWITENAVPGRRDDAGRPVEVFLSGAEVTSLRDALREVSKREAWTREVLDSATDAVYVLDSEGRFEWANPATARLFGRPMDELLTLRLLDVLDPRDHADLERNLERTRRGEPRRNEHRIRRPDGSVVWLEVRAHRLPGNRVEAIARDVTEHKALEAERDRLLSAVEQSFDVVAVLDAEQRVRWVNHAFERLTGYRRDEVQGRPSSHLHHAERNHGAEAELAATGTWAGDVPLALTDGTAAVVSYRVSEVRDTAGELFGYIATGRDASYERELEARIAEAARIESIGQLAGGVAHDFNNSLTAILGYLDLVTADLAPDDRAMGDLKEIERAARRAETLTRQLLAFGRRSTLQPRALRLGDVTAGLEPMLRRLLGEDVRIEFERRPEPESVVVDPSLLEHAIVNLVLNARDAVGPGGTIRVETGPTSGNDAAVPATSPDEHRWSTVRIVDDGVGMAPGTAARIFEPFFTTKDSGKGSGLGLAMVQGFAAMSGGRVTVDSAPGTGTTMAIVLPCDVEPEDVEPAADPATADPPSATILVVEDEPVLLALATRILEGLGHQVLTAQSAEEALALHDQRPWPIDLVFSDVVLGGMDGLTLVRELRARCPGLPALLASGYTYDDVERRGLELGELPLLQKPYTRDTLAAAVAATLP